MADKDNENQAQNEWIENTLADFENLYPGLSEKLSTISAQYQIRLSMFPQPPAGGSSSSTSD